MNSKKKTSGLIEISMRESKDVKKLSSLTFLVKLTTVRSL